MTTKSQDRNFYFVTYYDLQIHLSLSQSVSPILLVNGLVRVRNEDSIACKFFRKGNICHSKGNVNGYSL